MNDITSTLTNGANITNLLSVGHDVAEFTATLVVKDPPSAGADWDLRQDCPFVRVKVYLPTEVGLAAGLRHDLRSPETVFLGRRLTDRWGEPVPYRELQSIVFDTTPGNLSACLAEARERLLRELRVLDSVLVRRAQRRSLNGLAPQQAPVDA